MDKNLKIKFTKRETEILNLLSKGKSKQYIQSSLNISSITLDMDIAHIRGLLNAENKIANIIFKACKEGVI